MIYKLLNSNKSAIWKVELIFILEHLSNLVYFKEGCSPTLAEATTKICYFVFESDISFLPKHTQSGIENILR